MTAHVLQETALHGGKALTWAQRLYISDPALPSARALRTQDDSLGLSTDFLEARCPPQQNKGDVTTSSPDIQGDLRAKPTLPTLHSCSSITADGPEKSRDIKTSNYNLFSQLDWKFGQGRKPATTFLEHKLKGFGTYSPGPWSLVRTLCSLNIKPGKKATESNGTTVKSPGTWKRTWFACKRSPPNMMLRRTHRNGSCYFWPVDQDLNGGWTLHWTNRMVRNNLATASTQQTGSSLERALWRRRAAVTKGDVARLDRRRPLRFPRRYCRSHGAGQHTRSTQWAPWMLHVLRSEELPRCCKTTRNSRSSRCQAPYLPVPLVTVPPESQMGWFCTVAAHSLHFQLGGGVLIFCPILFTFPFST